MTDTDKLKRLAEAIAKRPRPSVDYTLYEGYYCAADPTTILALIADNERLKAKNEGVNMHCDAVTKNYFKFLEQRDEAVALLRDMDGVRMYDEEWAPVAEFLSRIDAKGSE